MLTLLVCTTVLFSGVAGGPGSAAAQERKNVEALTPTELAGLRRAVAVMKSRDAAPRNSADWRRSWLFWANVHGYFGGGCSTDPLGPGMEGVRLWTTQNNAERNSWCTCQHKSDAFLTWHRLALYHFERVLQQAAGLPTLRLPYWDWTVQPGLPAAFRSPTYVNDQGQTVENPLYVPNRASALNAGTAVISASARRTANAMAATTHTTFRERLENQPHGTIHCSIAVSGCKSGYMGHLSSAALDPIFWLHHANIDRLYDCWTRQGANRTPSSAELNRVFQFPDQGGAIVSIRVRDGLTLAQLGYSYAAGSGCGVTAAALKGEAAPTAEPAAERLWLAQERPRATLPPGATQRGRRPVLRLENVAPDGLDPGMYDVYIVRPDGQRTAVGMMSFFGLDEQAGQRGHAGHAGQGGLSFDFDLQRAVRELGLRPGDPFEIAFERTTGLEPAPGVRAQPAAPLQAQSERRGRPLQIGRIAVEARVDHEYSRCHVVGAGPRISASAPVATIDPAPQSRCSIQCSCRPGPIVGGWIRKPREAPQVGADRVGPRSAAGICHHQAPFAASALVRTVWTSPGATPRRCATALARACCCAARTPGSRKENPCRGVSKTHSRNSTRSSPGRGMYGDCLQDLHAGYVAEAADPGAGFAAARDGRWRVLRPTASRAILHLLASEPRRRSATIPQYEQKQRALAIRDLGDLRAGVCLMAARRNRRRRQPFVELRPAPASGDVLDGDGDGSVWPTSTTSCLPRVTPV